MKPVPFGVLAGFLAVVAVGLILVGRPPAAQDAATAEARVTAAGEAVIWATPDEAEVSFRVRVEGADAANAEALLRAAVDRATAELGRLVPRGDVRVTDHEVHPRTGIGSAYVSTAALRVRVANPSQVDAVVAAVMGLGPAFDYQGVTYALTDSRKEERTAIAQAIATARERAAAAVQKDPDRLQAMPDAEVEVSVGDASGSDRVPVRARVRVTFTYRP